LDYDLLALGPERELDEGRDHRLRIPDVAAMLSALATELSRART